MDTTLRRALREFFREFFGPFRQLVTNLTGDDGERWSTEFKKFLRGETCWQRLTETWPPTFVETRLRNMEVGECFLDEDGERVWMKASDDRDGVVQIVPVRGTMLGAVHRGYETDFVAKIVSPFTIN